MNLHQHIADSRELLLERLCNRLDSALVLYARDPSAGDGAFRIVGMNAAAARIGRIGDPASVVGSDVGAVFPGARAMGLLAALERVCASGDGEILPPLHYDDGARRGWFRNAVHRLEGDLLAVVFSDVTEEVESQRRLEESDTRLRLLTHALGDGIFDWDIAGDTLYFSPAWKAQLGYADHELENRFATWSERLHPEEREAQLHKLDEFLRGGERTWESEFRLRHRDGRFVWIRARATALRDGAAGAARRVLGVHLDIDAQTRERRAAQQSLDARVRELTGLYQIFRLAQQEKQLSPFAEGAAAFTLQAMEHSQGARCCIEVAGQVFVAGAAGGGGARLSAAIGDGGGPCGSVRVDLPPGVRGSPDDQRFLEGAAQALDLWLRGERDRREIERFRQIVASTRDCVALVTRDLVLRVVNPAYAELIGRPAAALQGRPVAEVLDPALLERATGRLERVFAGEELRFREWRSTPQGERLIAFTYSPFGEGGEVRGAIATGHDITDLHDAQAGLRRAAKVFAAAREAIFATDLDGVITDVNPAFCEITGYTAQEAVGRRASLLSSGRHDEAFFRDMFARVGREGEWRGEIWNRRPDGEIYPCKQTISAVQEDGELHGYVCVFSDATPQKRYEQQLELLANHDTLTGLPNRAALMRMLRRSIEMGQRQHGAFSVMFVDLDHFKDVNDSLGHAAGDELLREATRRLGALLRVVDMLARVGGDEFVIVLPGMQRADNASVVADKVLQRLAQPFVIDGVEVKVAASIGICSYPGDGEDAQTLLRNADTAMYQAKRGGRAAWCCYDADMTDKAARHLHILTRLRKALDGDELLLFYQPQYDLDSGELRAVEALLRWPPCAGDGIDTAELIRVAERGGLVAQVDRWALDTACAQLARWRAEGEFAPRMVVNISGASLQLPNFAEAVERCLARHGLDGALLELQVREEALHNPPREHAENLQRLVSLGVGLSIDGFGTAYSSLLQLNATPLSRISIDASLTRGLEQDPAATRVVESILRLAESLSLEVVVQGLETAAQKDYLRRFSHLLGQGFLLGPPVEAARLSALQS